jgi:hypothetical protein
MHVCRYKGVAMGYSITLSSYVVVAVAGALATAGRALR